MSLKLQTYTPLEIYARKVALVSLGPGQKCVLHDSSCQKLFKKIIINKNMRAFFSRLGCFTGRTRYAMGI